MPERRVTDAEAPVIAAIKTQEILPDDSIGFRCDIVRLELIESVLLKRTNKCSPARRRFDERR